MKKFLVVSAVCAVVIGILVIAVSILSTDFNTTSNSVAAGATPSVTKVVDKPKVELTKSQQNAVRAAKNYLDYTSFSKRHLIKQLVEFNKFTEHDATIAVNSMTTVDYNKQAYRTAKDYLDYTGFSKAGLIKQMTQFDLYTEAQAEYAADQAGL